MNAWSYLKVRQITTRVVCVHEFRRLPGHFMPASNIRRSFTIQRSAVRLYEHFPPLMLTRRVPKVRVTVDSVFVWMRYGSLRPSGSCYFITSVATWAIRSRVG